jgi:hypothetical protein
MEAVMSQLFARSLFAFLPLALVACEGRGRLSWLAGSGPAAPTIDGQFTGWNGARSPSHEWSFATPLRGQYAVLYLSYLNGNLYLLNDWLPNTTKEVPPRCFNYFQFTVGSDAFEVRAYGDQHLEATLNGVDVSEQGESATGFHSSPNLDTPHSIFELRLPVPDASAVQMSLCDPSSSNPPALQASVDPSAGCDSVDKLLWEPGVVQATLTGGDANPNFAPTTQPIALGLSRYRASAGESVTVDGRGFGSTSGAVLIDGRLCPISAWSSQAITFAVPGGAAGRGAVMVTTADGASSGLLYLDVASGAPCSSSCVGRQCGDDGCGGLCGTCAIGSSCDPSGQCSTPAPPG